MNIWIKRIGFFLLLPIIITIILSILLYIPGVQNFAVQQATRFASEGTGMQISIERIRLSFPIKLKLHGVEVIRDTIPADTLLSLKDLNIAIRPIPLLSKELLVESVGMNELKLNTGNLIDGMEIKGVINTLQAKADRISLNSEKATLNNLQLSDAAVTLFLTESTTPADTTDTVPLNWKINLEKIDLTRVALALQMPEDSMRLSGFVTDAQLRDGEIDLGKGSYRADKFTYTGSDLSYDSNEQPAAKGLDPSHIQLSDIKMNLKSLYYSDEALRADIKKLIAKERSGLEIKRFTGEIKGDKLGLKIPELKLETPYSEAALKGTLPYAAFTKRPKGSMNLDFYASLGKNDVITFIGNLPEEAALSYPDTSLNIQAKARGNMNAFELEKFDIQLPGAFVMRTTGNGSALQSNKKRAGDFKLEVFTDTMSFVRNFLPLESRSSIRIPNKMMLAGDIHIKDQLYQGDLQFREGRGNIHLNTTYNMADSVFSSVFTIDSLNPNHFMSQDSLRHLTATLKAEGKGFNPLDSLTQISINGEIKELAYGRRKISGILLNGSLKDQSGNLELSSKYPHVLMDMTMNAQFQKDYIKTMLIADMKDLDLKGLNLTSKELNTSFQIFAEAETNLKDFHKADLTLGNWEIRSGNNKVEPKPIILKAETRPDTTYLSFHSGDLALKMAGKVGLNKLNQDINLISKEVDNQLKTDSVVNLYKIRSLFPELQFNLTARKDNPLYFITNIYEYTFHKLDFTANVSPQKGLEFNGGIYKLLRDTFLLDTVKLKLEQDSLGINYQAGIIKKKFKRQIPFSTTLKGKIIRGYADAVLEFKNAKGKTGILLGTSIEKDSIGGYKLKLFPEEPIIAFSPFSLNKDNYINIKNEKEIKANLLLKGRDDAFLEIKNVPSDNGYDEVRLALDEVNLRKISQGFSEYLPGLDGTLDIDMQYMPTDSSYTLTAGANIDSLCYDRKRVGNMLLSAVYLPLSLKEHQFDFHLFRDDKEFMNSFVYYNNAKAETDSIDGELLITDLPLPMFDAFIPDDMATLKGKMQGEASITGTSERPNIRGYAHLDSAQMFITAANTTIKFDTAKIKVEREQLLFDKFRIFAHGKNPFVINGNINYSNPSDMIADLQLNANRMQLLDTEREKESMVYGKILVDMNSTVKGPLNSLKMRGNLNLLGGTNVTYVLQDSPLTVQDRLNGLVTFTSFDEDTILSQHRKRRPPIRIGGMDMLMTIHIDQSVQINADLTPDQSNRVNLEGGGDLTFQYTSMGDMILSGRYTLTDGTIKYSLPLIPLKEFNVKNGSFVQWDGNPLDPTINITATERIRTTAYLDDKSSRMVNFDVGINLTQRLENLGINFILNAPEDAALQEQLARMGQEERAKQAVSMLVTGMYLGSGNKTGKANLNMGAALNSFLQNEINNIAGSALKTVDINFGMESYDTDGDGSKRTDYSFRFAKRFYNDRIRIVLGGRISTGDDISRGQNQSFIDNVSVEYRLDPSGTRYIKLFHNKDYESLLEGELIETGVGIVLHKKMQYLRELFIFKRNKTAPINEKEKEKDKNKEK